MHIAGYQTTSILNCRAERLFSRVQEVVSRYYVQKLLL
jgi:hypothetical protein